jgi:hypothetical protein
MFHKIKNINCVIVSVVLTKWSYIATDINETMQSTREMPLHVKVSATIARRRISNKINNCFRKKKTIVVSAGTRRQPSCRLCITGDLIASYGEDFIKYP